jgi:4a-hydroxytetrahydrobiopterin dehydratase
MAVEPLSQQEIEGDLADLPGWSLSGDRITCTYFLDSHLAAAGLVGEVAGIQDELDHHSDLTLGYRTVAVSVNTHSVGGKVTHQDLELARRIAEIAPRHGAQPA